MRATKNAQVIGNENKTAFIRSQTGKKRSQKKVFCLVTKERPSTLVLPQKLLTELSTQFQVFLTDKKKKKKKNRLNHLHLMLNESEMFF